MVDRDLRVEIDVLTAQLLLGLELDEEREQEKLDVERQLWWKFRHAQAIEHDSEHHQP
jgi:hypothetical protein